MLSFKFNQVIREEGPESHHNKSGTPTMGGLLIVPVGLIVGNLITYNGINSHKLIALTIITLAYMLIGYLDDFNILSRNSNRSTCRQNSTVSKLA